MNKYEILMPMAGLGQRFRDNGINTPKPLIEFKEKPLFLHSLLSLSPIIKQSRISFLVYKNDEITNLVKNSIEDMNLNYQIIELDSRTRGPAETILMARHSIDGNLPVLSIDCDLKFSSKEYFQIIHNYQQSKISGVVCFFKSNNARFSYIQSNKENEVLQVAEKKVISGKALIGSYFFSKASPVFNTIDQLLSEPKEIYLSHIMDRMLKEGHRFKCCSSDNYISLGTPEELNQSLNK